MTTTKTNATRVYRLHLDTYLDSGTGYTHEQQVAWAVDAARKVRNAWAILARPPVVRDGRVVGMGVGGEMSDGPDGSLTFRPVAGSAVTRVALEDAAKTALGRDAAYVSVRLV